MQQPAQKKEPRSWEGSLMDRNCLKIEVDQEIEDAFAQNEFVVSKDMSFDVTADTGDNDASTAFDKRFPVELNPGFDLQAFFTVLLNHT